MILHMLLTVDRKKRNRCILGLEVHAWCRMPAQPSAGEARCAYRPHDALTALPTPDCQQSSNVCRQQGRKALKDGERRENFLCGEQVTFVGALWEPLDAQNDFFWTTFLNIFNRSRVKHLCENTTCHTMCLSVTVTVPCTKVTFRCNGSRKVTV